MFFEEEAMDITEFVKGAIAQVLFLLTAITFLVIGKFGKE
jgi:hypothetical protein